MMIWIYILIILIGLSVGSFMNVLVLRLDRKEGIISGRSECLNCHKRLAWLDMIPVISYFFLGGKCRYCKTKISLIYPIVELTTASAIFGYFFVHGLDLSLIFFYHLTLIILLVALIFFDILYLILPDKIVFSMGVISMLYAIFFRNIELFNLLLSGFLFALGFAIIYLASQGRGMGFGDVKLAFVLGLIMGYPTGLLSIVVAIWSAALIGIIFMVFRGANLKTALPFGSFLSASAIVFIIFNDKIEETVKIYKYFL